MAVLKKDSAIVTVDKMSDNEMGDPDVEVSESETESEEDEDVKLTEASKKAIYNRHGLVDMFDDIGWPENMDWINKLSIHIDREQEVNVNDDLAWELAFYTRALEGTRQAFVKFQSMGVPF